MSVVRWCFFSSVAVALSIMGAPVSAAPPTQVVILHGDGAVSPMPFMQAAAAEIEKEHPNVKLQVESHNTTLGISRFVDQRDVDWVHTARAVKQQEFDAALAKGRLLHMTPVVAEAVAIVVHPDNPLANVDHDKLRALCFDGAQLDWADLTNGQKKGAIHVLGVDQKTGTGDLVSTVIGKGKPWAKSVTVLADPRTGPARVLADPDAITFVSRSSVPPTVKSVSLDGIVATDRTIVDATYLLNRRLSIVTDGPPQGAVAAFVKFLVSERGQRLAKEKGFTPLALD